MAAGDGLRFNLWQIIPDLPLATIVDVGAMLVPGEAPLCGRILEAGRAKLIGFEPDPEECTRVNARLGPPHWCFPFFVGDGTARTFYQTNMAMTGSLYPPRRGFVDRFNNLGEGMVVQATRRVDTVTLDAALGDHDVDLLKMDVQGAELDVLRGAKSALSNASIVQTEVSFVEMYEGQCLFADVDQYLRAAGFVFHTFMGIAGRTLKPLTVNDDLNRPIRQFLWTDAVYIPDITQLDRVPTEKLSRLAMLLHDEYGSFDICHAVLGELDRRQGSVYQGRYIEAMESGVAQGMR